MYLVESKDLRRQVIHLLEPCSTVWNYETVLERAEEESIYTLVFTYFIYILSFFTGIGTVIDLYLITI